jgi:hypothetical protein
MFCPEVKQMLTMIKFVFKGAEEKGSKYAWVKEWGN